MEKRNLRMRIVLVALIFFGALFFLFSCKKEEEQPMELFINSYPTNLVVQSASEIDKTGLEVIGIFQSGSAVRYDFSSLLIKDDDYITDTATHPGLEIRYYRISYPKNPNIYTVYPIIINPQLVRDPVTKYPVINENAQPIIYSTKVSGSFSYQFGHEFNRDYVLEKVFYTDGTTNYDRGISLKGLSSVKYLLNNEEYPDTSDGTFRQIILRGGTYKVKFSISIEGVNLNTPVPVLVAGGESPIHLKYGTSAQWFDYILVIWVAYIMNYTSFGLFWLGILLTTIIVRTMAWPIYANSNNMSFKMALANPDIQKLEEKYRNRTDKMSQQQKQQETMKIYKKYGIKFSGCLLMILQFPIFTAMWQVVRRITVAGGMFANTIKDTPGFGLSNFLSGGTSSWTFSHLFLVIIMSITYIVLMLVGQKKPAYLKKTANHHKSVATKQPAKAGGPMGGNMGKMMMWVMTAMMIFMAFSNNNALTFYWIVGNLYSLFQTMLMKYLNGRKYRLIQVKSSIGSLYEDKYQRKLSYKQLVIDEYENSYYENLDKIANPQNNSKIKTFFNRVLNIFYLIPTNFINKIIMKIKKANLEKLKNKQTIISGPLGGK
ncbi:MAG: YidC/Oxa1 family membrane protein insertase [Acholeplasmatales bacterium]|jgi:YidC/Oxa1 family membrane protein insertase|nr:YidC/Oxa1 family membrane protein insertase [Acholeplasmatales bacterium]